MPDIKKKDTKRTPNEQLVSFKPWPPPSLLSSSEQALHEDEWSTAKEELETLLFLCTQTMNQFLSLRNFLTWEQHYRLFESLQKL